MSERVKFNPELCNTPGKDLDLAQRNLVLAFLPYLGAPLVGSDVSRDACRLISTALEALKSPLGPWKLAWGPGLLQVVPGSIPDNTMFVAEHRQTGELFISIAGTNPFSAYAWFAEDFDVDETRPWNYGKRGEGGAVSKGTLTGLRALQGMVPGQEVPGRNLTLNRFLEKHLGKRSAPVAITVSGHSLGGALSPALALWLLDTQAQWDPQHRATISVYAYAGPTPGDSEFASYIDNRFGERLHRIFNPLDIVTQAWTITSLADLKALYTPDIARDDLWDRAVDFLITRTNGIDYRHIDSSPVSLDGSIKQELVFRGVPTLVNLIGQVLYQHTLAYFELLGVAFPEEQSEVGRKLSHEAGNVTHEVLARAGMWEPLSRLFGGYIRLVAEAYSRLPLAPSPVPRVQPD